MAKIKAAIFDLDGTLLDSLEDIANAMNAALREHGFPTHPIAPYRYFVGEGVDLLVRRTLPEEFCQDDERCIQLRERMKAHYAESWHCCTHPYPGILKMLASLEASGLPIAVYSNKPHAFTVDCVAHYFGETPWASVEGAREGRPLKPAPDGALDIAKILKLAPEQMAFVGDTATDMETANRAGMTALGVTWGFREREELVGAGAHHCFDSAASLTDVLLRQD